MPVLVHETLARVLARSGVTCVFGVLGDGNLFMMDDFVTLAGGRYYSMANESAAVLAASGFARTAGGVGVATVTHGPALTNTVTALAEAAKARSALVLLAGDTAVRDRENLQNIAQRDVVLASGALFEQVRAPDTLEQDVARAFRTASVARMPVVLNIPVDFQWLDVPDQLPVATAAVQAQAVRPDVETLDAAAGVVASASRPLVLAGAGATSPSGRASLLRLAERVGAPVATSLGAKDLFRGEPFDLGLFGTLAHDVALDVMTRADTIVAFGAGLNRWTTADGSLLADKAVVQIDDDRAALEQWSVADVAMVADAGAAADALVELLNEADTKPTGFASLELADRLAALTAANPARPPADQPVDVQSVVRRIDEVFPTDRTLVADVGRFMTNALALVHVPHPSAYVHTASFGSIGLGMGNAIGAWFGAPGRPVLLVCGDGGFMLGGLAEFNTAVRHGVDLVVVVLNDGAYGAEHVQFRRREMDPTISTFDWPDLAPVATALGGRGFTVRTFGDLETALDAIEVRDRPILLDVVLDPDTMRGFRR